MAALGEPRQFVVRQRLPCRRIGDELPHGRANTRVLVERPHPDAHGFGVARIAAEDRRSADDAEPLLAAVGRLPQPQLLLARDDPERARSRMRRGRRCRTGTALAAPAVAIARADERLRHLVANGAAVTATGERTFHTRRECLTRKGNLGSPAAAVTWFPA